MDANTRPRIGRIGGKVSIPQLIELRPLRRRGIRGTQPRERGKCLRAIGGERVEMSESGVKSLTGIKLGARIDQQHLKAAPRLAGLVANIKLQRDGRPKLTAV